MYISRLRTDQGPGGTNDIPMSMVSQRPLPDQLAARVWGTELAGMSTGDWCLKRLRPAKQSS